MTHETTIIGMLNKGISHSKIARDLGIPRSRVRQIADEELGVDPESIKSLSIEEILEIQKLAAGGESKKALADAYRVGVSVITRALLVTHKDCGNNVMVISPVKQVDEDDSAEVDGDGYEPKIGGFCDYTSLDLEEGKEPPVPSYIAAFSEKTRKFVVIEPSFTTEGEGVEEEEVLSLKVHLLDKQLLNSSDFKDITHSGDIKRRLQATKFEEALPEACEIGEMILKNTNDVNNSLMIFVDGAWHSCRGSLDTRGRILFLDWALGATSRARISGNLFRMSKRTGETNKVNTEKEVGFDETLAEVISRHNILLTPNNMTIMLNGVSRTLSTSHESYPKVVEALRADDIKKAFTLLNPADAIEKLVIDDVVIDAKNRTVKWREYDVSRTSIASRLIQMAARGEEDNMRRLSLFMEKMFQNPSSSLVQSGRIYEFMAYSDIEIADDGDIYLYKSVRGNYMDKHSNTVDNTPGNIVRMARSFVNDNNGDLCSYGLHVCSLTYLQKCFGSLGQRVVRCKLNPRDIVSITDDYGSSKIRCCEYYVVDDYTDKYYKRVHDIDMHGFYK